MPQELEQPYQDLVAKAQYDPDAARRLRLLDQTLEEFEVLQNRTAVGGTLVVLDNLHGVRLHAYMDMEDPKNAHLIRMLTRFKQLQGKDSAPVGIRVDASEVS